MSIEEEFASYEDLGLKPWHVHPSPAKLMHTKRDVMYGQEVEVKVYEVKFHRNAKPCPNGIVEKAGGKVEFEPGSRYTAREIAKEVGCSYQTVMRYTKLGLLKCYSPGRPGVSRSVFLGRHVNEWLKRSMKVGVK